MAQEQQCKQSDVAKVKSMLSNQPSKNVLKSHMVDSVGGKPLHLPAGTSMSAKDPSSLSSLPKSQPLSISDLSANFGASALKGKSIRKTATADVSSHVKRNKLVFPPGISLENTLGGKFPLNFGRDITVTTSSKAKTLPVDLKSRESSNFPTGPPLLSSNFMARQLPLDLKTTSSQNAQNAQNLGFSVLQNLPSSMSLLLKQSNLSAAATQSLKNHQGVVDMSMSKIALPRLTPAPALAKKDHKIPSSSSMLSLSSLAASGGTPPALQSGMHPSSSSSTSSSSAISMTLSRPTVLGVSKPSPVTGKRKSDRDSEDSDVVILD